MRTLHVMQQQIAKHLGALGIHAKLTIWYTLIFTVLIILFAAIFYLHLRNVLFSNLDTQLQLRAQLVEGAITEHRGELTLHDATGRLFTLLDADDPSQQSILHKEHGLTAQQLDPDLDVLIQVRNTAGHVQYTTPAFTLLTPPAASIQQALHGQTGQNTFTARNGQHVRVYSQPIVYQHRPIGIVLVGIPLSQQESTLHHVLFELLLVGPILLLLGMIVSFWLTKRALRPITRLTGIARTIQEGDLRSRVPLPRSNDEVHLLAETFNEMIDHLEALFYQQRRFLSDASHELRTPIAALRSMTDVALSQPRSVEEYATLLQDINGQSERLGRLITDLLTLARADEGNIPFERDVVQLGQLTKEVAATMEPLARERNITLDVHINEQALVVGDEARLIQVIMNLLNNAITYTSKGGTITLSVDATDMHVMIHVQDTGIGIAAEHLPHIFERFYRVDNARSRAAGGTGLGLAISQWITTKHQGSMTVKSQAGNGSLFTVTLPRAKQGSSEDSSYSHKSTVDSVKG